MLTWRQGVGQRPDRAPKPRLRNVNYLSVGLTVHIKGQGTEFIRTNEEGTNYRFTFCSTYGSTVLYVEEGREQHIAIPVGGFADPAFPSPTVSVYGETMHSWVVMPKDAASI